MQQWNFVVGLVMVGWGVSQARRLYYLTALFLEIKERNSLNAKIMAFYRKVTRNENMIGNG